MEQVEQSGFHSRGNTHGNIRNQLHIRVRGGNEGMDIKHAIIISSINIRSGREGGFRGRDTGATARKYHYWSTTGDYADWGYPHSL